MYLVISATSILTYQLRQTAKVNRKEIIIFIIITIITSFIISVSYKAWLIKSEFRSFSVTDVISCYYLPKILTFEPDITNLWYKTVAKSITSQRPLKSWNWKFAGLRYFTKILTAFKYLVWDFFENFFCLKVGTVF